ncbi:MAG: DUF1761 domain-containing protein [Frankia sp.]|nr:DUF1761 domain-containing protein [Frankia sp.]
MDSYSVEWVGVIVAVVAQMALGFLWYAPPVFGNRWMAAQGKTREPGSGGPRAKPFVIVIISALVTAVFISALLDWAGVDSAGGGALAGLYVGIVSALAVAGGDAFEGRPTALTLINAGSELARFTLVGLVLGLWQ